MGLFIWRYEEKEIQKRCKRNNGKKWKEQFSFFAVHIELV